MTEVHLPGLFAAGLRLEEVMVQASMALPLCRKILEGRLTIVSPPCPLQPLSVETTAEEDRLTSVFPPPLSVEATTAEEGLLNSRLSPIPLEFDPWLRPCRAVRLLGVPPDVPLALIKASLRGEGVSFRWASWSAVPGEALVEAQGPRDRRALLRRGLLLCGGGPRLRVRPAHEPGYVNGSVPSSEGLLEATRCEPFAESQSTRDEKKSHEPSCHTAKIEVSVCNASNLDSSWRFH